MSYKARNMNENDSHLNDPLGPLADQFIERYRRGEPCTPAQFAAEHPEHAVRILGLFPALIVMEELAPEDTSPTAHLTYEDPLDQALERIGEYRIVREIGRGGMGVVYEAEQESLGRQVALKVLSTKSRVKPEALERFQLEARAAARLHHPHIVPVFDVGQADGYYYYYAMQRIPGQGLDEVVSQIQHLQSSAGHFDGSRSADHSAERPGTFQEVGSNGSIGNTSTPTLSLLGQGHISTVSQRNPHEYYRRIAEIGACVGDALAYAHGQGVLHRDIKPSNLLLDLDGKVWITDFGLAKSFESTSSGNRDPQGLTRTGDLVGTLRYMAPERFRGWSDPRSDLYSLGITLYELLALRPAFEAADKLVLVENITQHQPAPLRRWDRHIPKDLETIIHKAIEKEPARRYTSCGELALDLRNYLQARPILARRVSTAERFGHWVRRNPLVASLSALLLMVVLGALATTYVLWTRAEAARSIAQDNLLIAEAARSDAQDNLLIAEAARFEAQHNLSVAEALNHFLLRDLLDQADVRNQLGTPKRSRNVTVRELLDRAAAEVEQRFQDQPLVEAAIRTTIGEMYTNLAVYTEAETHLQRSKELREKALGDDHADTLESMLLLGVLYAYMERVAEAEGIFQLVYERRKSSLGEHHPDTLQVLGNFGFLYFLNGNHDQAIESFQTVMEGETACLGAEHSRTLTTTLNLASALLAVGRLTEAEELGQAVLSHRREKLGLDHPETFETQKLVARIHLANGKFELAESMLDQLVDDLREHLDVEHPLTMAALNDLGLLYRDQGRFEEAERSLDEVLRLERAFWGEQHNKTLNAINNLAAVYRDQGKFDQALPLFERSLQGVIANRGPAHPKALIGRNNLAMLYQSAGRYEQVESILKEVIEGSQQAYGPEHANTLVYISNLGGHYMDRGRFDDAEPLFRQVYESRLQTLGPDRIETIASINHLGLVAQARQQYAEAKERFQEALQGRRAQLGDEHPDTLRTMNNLAMVYRETGERESADRLFQQVLEARRRLLGTHHPDTLTTHYQMALLYQKSGDTPQAAKCFQEAIAGAKVNLGMAHPQTSRFIKSFAEFALESDQPQIAEPELREFVSFFESTAGTDALDHAEALDALTRNLLAQEAYASAEQTARAGLDLSLEMVLNDHRKCRSQTLLGASLIGLGRFEEAEALLEQSHGRLQEIAAEDPATVQNDLAETIRLLIRLYEIQGQEDLANRWRAAEI